MLAEPDATDLETAIARLGASLLPDEVAKAASASQQWPGWFSDSQIAAEHAQKLARGLAAAVNADLLARNWIAQHGLVPRHRRGVPKRKRRKKRRQHRAHWQAQPPPAQQQQTTTRPAPRQFLNAAGVTAALYAVLLAILAGLWSVAFSLGWAGALALLGLGQIDGAERALADLQREGESRLAWILQTRMRRLEQVLMQALREGWSADRLAEAIRNILGNLASALLVAVSETTWASAWAAYWAYKLAGVQWVRWQTRNDALVCFRCMSNQKASPVQLGERFPSGDLRPLAHPRCRCSLLPANPPKPRNGAQA